MSQLLPENRKKLKQPVVPTSTFGDFFSEGTKLFGLRRYQLATRFLNKALEENPKSVETRILLSKCHMYLGDLPLALAEAEEVSRGYPGDAKATLQQALALFRMGRFEEAMVRFCRGFQHRPSMQEFTVGMICCKEAIENCVGDRIGLDFDEVKDTVIKLSGHSPSVLYSRSHTQDLKHSGYGITKILGSFNSDADFFKHLAVLDEEERADSLVSIAKGGLEFLRVQKLLWEEEKPLYARRNELLFSSKTLRQMWKERRRIMQAELQEKIADTAQRVRKAQQLMRNQIQNGLPTEALRNGWKVIELISKKPQKYVPERTELLCDTYGIIGGAYEDIGAYEKAIGYHVKAHELAKRSEKDELVARVLVNLGRSYARFKKYKKAVATWESTIPYLHESDEKAWLYHEIGRCYYEMNKLDAARLYGLISLEEGKAAEDAMWCLNAATLVAQTEFRMGRLRKAMLAFDEAEKYASELDNNMALSYVAKMKDEMEKMEKMEKTAGSND